MSGLNVEGMIMYVPGVNLNRALSSLELIKDFDLAQLLLYRKKSCCKGNGVESGSSNRYITKPTKSVNKQEHWLSRS